MDFRTRNSSFQQKFNEIYGELNNFHNRIQNKNKSTKSKVVLNKKNENKLKLIDKALNNPPKKNKFEEKNIIYLIEKTKRNSLGYKSFLNMSNNMNNNNSNILTNRFNRPIIKTKSFNSANSSFSFGNGFDNISRNPSKSDALKKEIMTELEKDKRKFSDNGSKLFSSNKSYKNIDNFNINGKLF